MSKWISVEERLPDFTGIVLVANARNSTRKPAWFNGENFVSLTSAFIVGATHWMPLPEPPERGSG